MRSIRLPMRAAFKQVTRVHHRARARSTTATVAESARAYNEIPRAKVLPYLLGLVKNGTSMPALQKLLEDRITWCAQTYGLLYRDSVPQFEEYVMVLDPHDVEKVWRVEGRWPYKADFIGVLKDARKDRNVHGGLLGTDGEEWNTLRKPVSKLAMPPRKVGEYYREMNEVAYDLIEFLRQQRSSTGIFHNMVDLSFRWGFEYISYFVLGDRLGCLEIDRVPEDCKEFIHAARAFEQSFQRAVFLPPFLYRLRPTKDFKIMTKSSEVLTDFALKHMERKMEKIKEMSSTINEQKPLKVDFLTSLLLLEKMSTWQMAGNVVDMLFGGLGPTSFTLSWALYKLATNPEVQNHLRSEVQEVVGSDDTVTPDHITRMPYLRNTLKETLRLYPVGTINFRVVQEDVVLSGYKIPAGTLAIVPQIIMARLPELFPQPERFMPERWSKENADTPNPFSNLPFGFGPRMCPGRRISELATHVGLAHIMKKFTIKFPEDTPMDYVMKIALSPKRQMNLVFEDL